MVRRGKTSYVFFEEYLYGEARGVISYIEVPDGELHNARSAARLAPGAR